ncbi:Vacuolar protein sorting-associated protein 33A [Orchesella cincta]|uniref:Vacuolar protein sorting-associated protein 33A n=1 Tax=Orchesella cincta TaxID=48709 RepID=A0A1D2N4Z1_ORCCI|nr:Vacuolar protein sorting-associated protein 33A [Orchesella cincta]
MSAFGMAEDEVRRPMNSVVDLEIIQQVAQKDLIALFQKCQGDKAIVWDRALANPMNLIATPKVLKEHGVVRMIQLDPGMALPHDIPETVLFICRPLVQLMPVVATCVRNEEKHRRRRKFHLIFIPRTSKLCEKYLEEQGVLPSLESIDDLPIFLFPLDKDVLTLELDSVFKEFHAEMDPTGMHHIARALVSLQKRFGTPSKVFGKGAAASYVFSLMQNLKQESGSFKPQISGVGMDYMILIDRQIDPLSPLVTQLTYEGLIDEFYGISNNQVKLPEEKFGETKTIFLSSGEELYAELRDKNFSAIGGILRSKTSKIQEKLRQKERGNMSVTEMKQLVQHLPAIQTLKQSLSTHTSIAELIKAKTETDEFLSSLECEQELLSGMGTEKINSHIENLCGKKAPLNTVLRLLLIQSITSGGLKANILQHYQRLIMQNYGFQHVLTLQRLYAMGLLRLQGGSRYTTLRRALNLTVCDVSEINPTDFAYVHSIYAPLSIRLIQHRLKPSLWANLKDSLLSLLPGPTVDEDTEIPVGLISGKRSTKFTVVVFIGGCTFAEISALRFLAQQDDEREFLVVTSKIINGNTFLKSLQEDILSVQS